MIAGKMLICFGKVFCSILKDQSDAMSELQLAVLLKKQRKPPCFQKAVRASKAWYGHGHGFSLTRPGTFSPLVTPVGDARSCSVPIAQIPLLWGCNLPCGSARTLTGQLPWRAFFSLFPSPLSLHPHPAPGKGLLKAVTLISAACYPDKPRLPLTAVAPNPCRKQLTLLVSLCELFIKALLVFRASTQ